MTRPEGSITCDCSEANFPELPPVKLVVEAHIEKAFEKDSNGEVVDVWGMPEPSPGLSSRVLETGFAGTS